MPNVHFSFRRGAGDVPEILYGKVEIKPTLAFARGTSLVLPAPTTLDLVNGEATANNVYPTPVPVAGQVEWAYRVKAIDTRGQSFEWMVGVPDGTGTVEFTALPRYFETKPPMFGEGPQGVPGEAANITVGAVTGGATASVTNSGTNQNAVLDFVLPKGDKGDKGDGVPSGGSALQYIRKDASGAVTEWATLDKSAVGLGNVDNTSDADKPVSSEQKTYTDNITTLTNYTKLFTDAPSTYPQGTSTLLVNVSDGWPPYTDGISYMQVTTVRSRGNQGGTLQWITGYGTATVTPLWFRTANSAGVWSEIRPVVEANTNKITIGSGALKSLAHNYNVGSNGSVVSLGWETHGNMIAVKKSIAIGSGALSQGLRSRDNVGIGEDALWATESSSADYVQSDRGGTRNVAIGGAAGRYNKTGIGHVLIGRGAGASIVSGNGAVVIGSNANAGAQPIGLSGQIENWGNFFEGDPEARTRFVAVGCEAAWGNSAVGTTAVGDRALTSNTKGEYNSAFGDRSLESLASNTWINGGLIKSEAVKTGTYVHSGNDLTLTISGHGAVAGDVVRIRLLTGSSATFLADRAYAVVVSASSNTFTVEHPVSNNSSGDASMDGVFSTTAAPKSQWNTSIGALSLRNLVTGNGNASIGFEAGRNLSSGNFNVFSGYGAGRFLTTGTGNLIAGYLSGNHWVDGTEMTGADGVITIGQYARASANNQMQLGSSAVTVYTQSAVQTRSDRRDKTDIRDTSLGLDFINKLRPVDYKWDYREDYLFADGEDAVVDSPKDGSKTRKRFHHGLIAQEVQEVIEETGVDFGGFQDHKVNGGSDVLSIGYEELIAPLIKAVQELSAEVKALKEAK